MPDAWIEHEHGRLFARIWAPSAHPGGSPIVLFHDSLGCVDLWRTFPAALCESTGRTVIAYDRLGFGRSSARTDKLSLDFISHEAATCFPALRRQLRFTRFIAFGHSVGGGMALHCAAAFSQDCDAVITESAQAFVEDRTVRGLLDAREQFKEDGAMARLRKYHGEKAGWVLNAWTGTWLDPEFAAWSLDPVLPLVTCPILVIHGLDDEYGSSRHAEIIAQRSSGPARLEILAGAHHVPHREREESIVGLVGSFIAAFASV